MQLANKRSLWQDGYRPLSAGLDMISIDNQHDYYCEILLELAETMGLQAQANLSVVSVESLIELFENQAGGLETATQLGKRIPVTAHGMIGIGFLTAPTLRKAIEFAHQNQHLFPDTGIVKYAITQQQDDWHISIMPLLISEKSRHFIVDILLTLIDSYIGLFTGRRRNAKALYVMRSDRKALRCYQSQLGNNVILQSEMGGYTLDKAILNCTSPMADTMTFRQTIKKASEETEKLRLNTDIERATRQCIRENISGDLSLANIADNIGISKRSLRYQLNKKDILFSELVDSERFKIAIELLSSERTTISKIAYRLGYNSESNFSAAFKRWTGLSPRNWQTLKPQVNTALKEASAFAGTKHMQR